MRGGHDLVVLGGGTAGLVSAFVAAGIGARVALVERDRTGGDCLWSGCVPSKSLIAAASLAHRMRTAGDVGLAPVAPQVDLGRVMDRVHAAIATLEPQDSVARLRAAGVEVLPGAGAFTGPRSLVVAGRTLRFAAAIVATGSAPAPPPIDGLRAGGDILTTETIWSLRELPRRLVVLGAGPVGCELGQAFARLGSQVTLLEAADRPLAAEEPAASALIAATLRAEGVVLRCGARVTAVRDGAVALGGERVPFDRLLIAAGRRPRTRAIGLEAAGVEVDARGAVVVDEALRTSAQRIFAAGDVTGGLAFTHVAAHHARVAAPNALLGTRRHTDPAIPVVTFTDPEVARVGLSEAQARARWGDRATVARSDYAELDRAVTDARAKGFALLVGDPRGRLTGATVAGPAAGEAIAELTARVKAGDRIDALSSAVHAYPTLAEGPARAADEHVRARYAKRRYRLLAAPVLAARRVR